MKKIGTSFSKSAAAFFNANARMLFLGMLFLLGVVIGISLLNGNSPLISEFSQKIARDHVSQRLDQSFLTASLYMFLAFLPFALVSYFSGLCAAGAPVSAALPVFKGAGYGLSVSFFYVTFGAQGIAYSALMILPHQFLCALALILMSRESMRFSRLITRNIAPGRQSINLWNDFKLYSLRFVCFLVIPLVSSFLGAFLSSAFSGFFTFHI